MTIDRTASLETLDRWPMPVVQLVYRSRSRDGAESALQMSDILDQARIGNAREGVSGVLTVVNGYFVQIIEGAEAAIDGLLARLRRDPRHTELTVIERRASPDRLFGDWDMVSPRLAAHELALLALLFEDPGAGVDAYAQVLARAVSQQEAVLEGRASAADQEPRIPGIAGRAASTEA